MTSDERTDNSDPPPPPPLHPPTPVHTLNSFNHLSLHPHPYPSIPHSPSPPSPPPRRLQIVAFGASLTQQAAFPSGWFSLLCARYVGRADLFNRGYSGYTTRNAITLLRTHTQHHLWPLPPPAPSPAPSTSAPGTAFTQLIILSLGSNDSCLRYSTPPFLHVPLPAFIRNLRAIIGLLVPALGDLSSPPPPCYPPSPTALVLLTPLDDPHWLAYRRFKYHQPLPDPSLPLPPTPYIDAVRALATTYHIPLCDLAAMCPPSDVCTSRTWTWDGCHLNAEGNARLFTELVRVIETAYPSLAASALPVDG